MTGVTDCWTHDWDTMEENGGGVTEECVEAAENKFEGQTVKRLRALSGLPAGQKTDETLDAGTSEHTEGATEDGRCVTRGET